MCHKFLTKEMSLCSCLIIIVTSLKNGEVILIAWRNKHMFVADLRSCNTKNLTCLSVQDAAAELWHKRLGHVSCSLLKKIVTRDLVRGMTKLKLVLKCVMLV